MSDGSAPAVRIGDPDGPFRRRIRTVAVDDGVVEGGLEDDFHHFEITLRHDGERVTSRRVAVPPVAVEHVPRRRREPPPARGHAPFDPLHRDRRASPIPA